MSAALHRQKHDPERIFARPEDQKRYARTLESLNDQRVELAGALFATERWGRHDALFDGEVVAPIYISLATVLAENAESRKAIIAMLEALP